MTKSLVFHIARPLLPFHNSLVYKMDSLSMNEILFS